jgi:hypothetical protein
MVDYQIMLGEPSGWERASPADLSEIQLLQSNCSIELPKDYLDFFEFSNGAYGELPVQPYWCDLFQVNEVLKANKDYEIDLYLPGYFAIGTNGAGEILLFDTKERPWCVVSIHRLSFGIEDIIPVAKSFSDLIKMLGQEAEDIEE